MMTMPLFGRNLGFNLLGEEPFHLCDLVQFHSPISGGIRRYITDKARFFEQHEGIRHSVIIPGERDLKWTEGNADFIQIRSPLIPGSKSYRSFTDTSRIRSFLDELNPDLIEVADPYQSAWTAIRWAEMHDARVALFYHSDFPRAWHRTLRKWPLPGLAFTYQQVIDSYLRRTFSHTNAVLVATEKYQRYWKTRIPTPVYQVGLGFDPSSFRPIRGDSGVRSSLGIASDQPLVLYAGRFAPEKRLPLLLSTFARLKQRLPSAELLMVGDGEQSEELKQLARHLDLSIHWMPFCSDTERLAAIYSACDVYAHPARNETFGFTVTEALACGTPVVAFHQSGLEASCRNSKRSVLVRENDLDQFVHALYLELTRPHTWGDRLEMHEEVRSRASIDITLNNLLGVYRQILRKPATTIAFAA